MKNNEKFWAKRRSTTRIVPYRNVRKRWRNQELGRRDDSKKEDTTCKYVCTERRAHGSLTSICAERKRDGENCFIDNLSPRISDHAFDVIRLEIYVVEKLFLQRTRVYICNFQLQFDLFMMMDFFYQILPWSFYDAGEM